MSFACQNRRAMRLAATAVAVLALAGCGNDRSKSPNVTTPGPSLGANPAAYPEHGIRFTAPAGWNLDAGEAPLVATVQTGQATAAFWRYPRTERLPTTKAELDAARKALLEAAKSRDDTFVEIKSAATRIAGQPAVQIRARETIEGQPRVVRSTHVYAFASEIVVDAYASPDDFRRVDADVFRPLLRSLRISKPTA